MKNFRRQLPSLNALFAFEAACRHRNFSKAAEELNVTPAAVSRMMQRLEAHLAVRLFHRGPAGLSLSENGQLLYQATARAMSQIGAVIAEIERRSNDADRVTLSVSTAFTTHWLMPRMAKFKAAFPLVDLRFQLLMGPLTGPVSDVDLGMRFLLPDKVATDRRIHPVMPEVLVPLCNPSYREMRRHEAHGDTMILLSGSGSQPADDMLEQLGPRTWNSQFFDDYAIVIQAALLGQGICWGWLNVVGHWMNEGQLVPVIPRAWPAERICCLIENEAGPLRDIVAQVRDWIIAEMQADYRLLSASHPELAIPGLF